MVLFGRRLVSQGESKVYLDFMFLQISDSKTFSVFQGVC